MGTRTAMCSEPGSGGKILYRTVRISSMRLETALDDVFRTGSHVRVLRVLHRLLPGVTLSARDLARRAYISHPTASSVLGTLVELGLVRLHRAGRLDFCELNRDHVFAEDLGRLFDRETGLRNELIECIRDQLDSDQIALSDAFLFGSAARGEMAMTSDIDLALICPPDAVESVEEAAFGPIADAVRSRFGARLNAIVGSPSLSSLTNPRREGHQLWERISREGIAIIRHSEEALS
jgi:DNA-binding transcriptional ArsR family regulator